MANIAIFKAGKNAQYLKSVHTPDYSDDPDVLINPDISSVASIPLKFWKRSGDMIIEMNQTEKDTVLAAELQEKKDNANNFSVGPIETFTALIKVINLRLPQGQKITKQELIDAIKQEVT